MCGETTIILTLQKTSDLLDKKKKKTKETWQFSDILRRAKQNPSRQEVFAPLLAKTA